MKRDEIRGRKNTKADGADWLSQRRLPFSLTFCRASMACPCRETCLRYCSQKLTEGTNHVNVDKHERSSIFLDPTLSMLFPSRSVSLSFHFCPFMTRQPEDRGLENWHVAIRIFDSAWKLGICMAQALSLPSRDFFVFTSLLFKRCRPVKRSVQL